MYRLGGKKTDRGGRGAFETVPGLRSGFLSSLVFVVLVIALVIFVPAFGFILVLVLALHALL